MIPSIISALILVASMSNFFEILLNVVGGIFLIVFIIGINTITSGGDNNDDGFFLK
ncbi:MAG: hypothetical protein HDR82_04665 [Bacteroides sp.]|nr:hypothetical protein [Bacteroides sp.]